MSAEPDTRIIAVFAEAQPEEGGFRKYINGFYIPICTHINLRHTVNIITAHFIHLLS